MSGISQGNNNTILQTSNGFDFNSINTPSIIQIENNTEEVDIDNETNDNTVIDDMANFFNSVCNSAAETGANVVNTVSQGYETCKTFFEDVKSSMPTELSNIIDTGISLASTKAAAFVLIANAAGNLLEDVVDLAALGLAVNQTIPCAIADGISYLTTGETNGRLENLWSNTMSFVATEYVNDAITMFYEETDIGKTIDKNSYLKHDSDVYRAGVVITEIVGTIALTIFTAGGYGAAVGAAEVGTATATAGAKTVAKTTTKNAAKTMGKEMAKKGAVLSAAKGTAEGTSDAWNTNTITIEDGSDTKINLTRSELDEINKLNTGESFTKEISTFDENGNETKTNVEFIKNEDGSISAKLGDNTYSITLDETTATEGLLYGAVNGAWEGAQWYLGGQFAGKGIATIAADAVSGAVDVPLRSLYQGIYSDESLEQRFENNGGIQGVLLNTAIAGGLSGLGELPSSRKFLSSEISTKNNTETVVPKTNISTEIESASELLKDTSVTKGFSEYAYAVNNQRKMLFDDVTFKHQEIYDTYTKIKNDENLETIFDYLDEYGQKYNRENYASTVLQQYSLTGNIDSIVPDEKIRNIITLYNPEELQSISTFKNKIETLTKKSDNELTNDSEILSIDSDETGASAIAGETVFENASRNIDTTPSQISIKEKIESVEELLKDNSVTEGYPEYVKKMDNYGETEFTPINDKKQEIYSTYNELVMNSGLSDTFKQLDEYGISHGRGEGYAEKAIAKYIETGNPNYITRENGARDLITSYNPEELGLIVSFKSKVETLLKKTDDSVNESVSFSGTQKLSYANIIESLDSCIGNKNKLLILTKTFFANRDISSAYKIFTTMNNHRTKTIPSQEVIDEFNQNMSKYLIINQGTSFKHIRDTSGYYAKADKVTQRLYINIQDFGDTYRFVSEFCKKCEEKEIPFYVKTGIVDHETGKMAQSTLGRDESIVIYTSDEYLADYYKICDEITKEKYDLSYEQPPALTSTSPANDIIGIASEPKLNEFLENKFKKIDENGNVCTPKVLSYNQVRAKFLEESLLSARETYLKNHDTFDVDDEYLTILINVMNENASKWGIDPDSFSQNIS